MLDADTWGTPLIQFLETLKDAGPGRRGRTYATDGHLLNVYEFDYACVAAEVMGSDNRPYEATLTVDHGVVEGDCTCPFGVDCKHSYALALVLLGGAYRRGATWALQARDVLPPSWQAGRWSGIEALERDLDVLLGSDSSPKAGASPARAVQAPLPGPRLSATWWRDYLEADTAAARRAVLTKVMKARVADFYAPWYIDEFLRPFERFESPVEQLRRFDSALTAFAKRNGRKPPAPDAGLEAFLASDEAAATEHAYYRRQAEQALLQWLEPKGGPVNAERAYVELVWSTADDGSDLPQLCFQLLLTSKKLRGSPRGAQAIDQLSRDVEFDRRQMAPLEERLVKWIVRGHHHQAGSFHSDRGDSTLIGVRNALEWLTTWSRHDLIRWNDGGSVRLDTTPAALTVSAPEDGPPVWSVEFPPFAEDPGGRVPMTEAQLMTDLGQASAASYWSHQSEDRKVYVRRGDVLRLLDTGGMPLSVLAAARRAPEVPVERLRGSRAGAMLAQRLSLRQDRHDQAALVQEVLVRPAVECRLDGTSTVRIRARAQVEDGSAFQWNHAGEWEYTPAETPVSASEELENVSEEPESAEPASDPAQAPEHAAHAIAVVPRREDVQPVSDWLAAVARHAKFVTADDGTPLLEWRVKGKELFELLQVWSERPRHATFLGNRAFRNLVTPGRTPAIRVHAQPSGTDWLKVSVEMEQEIDALSLDAIAAALDAGQSELVYLPGGRLYRRDDLEEYRHNVHVLEEMGIELRSGEQRLHALQLAGAGAEALSELSDADEYLRGLADRARVLVKRFEGIPPARVPAPTGAYLRPYQQAGADFLVWAAKTFGGAVLADDMGLGKTLQMLAALSVLGKKEKKPSLVVCPASVAHNWQREAKRFAPSLRVVVIERGEGRRKVLERLEDYDLVIKNYALTRRDADFLRAHEWLAVCVDEAQAIKNPGAEITRTVKSLPAKYRFALTGTPIENRLTDLWSIVDFAIPGYLHNLARFEQRLRGPNAGAFHKVVRARLRPVLLRRAKAEVAPELPPRIEERRDCEMPASQRKAYLTEVQKTRLLLDGMSPNGGKKSGQDRIRMLAALTRLRQICCDPALVGLPDKGSGKVEQLLDLLPAILEEGHKVLLFSQFVRMLKRLEAKLKDKKIPTRMLIGATNNRQELVDAFESDPEPSVFLISLKAGGVGLNLPSASHVILFDPWWNPAVEAQAIDRTHRIGQDKTVIAFRLVAVGTVEERILELQERKRGLVSEVLEEEAFNRSLTRDDFAYLLGEEL